MKGKRVGVEIKYADAPTFTKSMAIAMKDLKLDRLLVIYPGAQSYPLRRRVDVVAIHDLKARLGAAARPTGTHETTTR
jgi:hypothetical protein